ncbi:MAG: hypothetical protein GX896_05525 [Clostridiales bacterium]|jgi:hypothetical protein|nr:hypothetical protein [Clostridiales bacterium]
MSTYVSPMQLQINSNLFSIRENELKHLVGNLKPNDVKDDVQFTHTTARIKNNVLLKPVTFQDPKITNHSQVEKNYPPDFQNLFGGKRMINIISVEFQFDGSSELFNYSPNNLSFGSSSNMRVYQPYGNSITVDVELPDLDKNKAISAAKAQMEMTFGVINGNNTQAIQWNMSIESSIDSMLIAKRKELLDFYS